LLYRLALNATFGKPNLRQGSGFGQWLFAP
jgi:hypothetical protein